MPVTIRGSGQVPVQVLQAVKTDTSTTSSLSFGDITGLSVNITPTNSSNKILIIVTLNGCVNSTNNISFNIVRNSTAIAQPDGAGTYNATINLFNNGPGAQSTGITFLDSPNTTSSTTYKIQWRVDAGTAVINRHASGTNYNAVSSITVMEISQ
jgi:hypothetical protein